MKKYCQKCGAPTEYTLTKPKYCTKCGSPFDAADQLKSTEKVLKMEIDEDLDGYSSESSGDYKNIKNLEFDELSASKLKGEKLEDLIKQNVSPSKKGKRKKIKISKSETDRILKETLNEAKTLRPKK